jgi:hypothetical protein
VLKKSASGVLATWPGSRTFSVRSARPSGCGLAGRAFLNILLRSWKIGKFWIPISSQNIFEFFNILLGVKIGGEHEIYDMEQKGPTVIVERANDLISGSPVWLPKLHPSLLHIAKHLRTCFTYRSL